MLKLAIFVGSLFLLAFFFYIFCLNHVGVNEIGVAYNSVDGDVSVQEDSGWYYTSPMVSVCSISVAPMRVQIPSTARVINSKIIRFKKEGAIEFIRLQGHHYMMDNELNNILLGYAYSGTTYPFLEVIQEAKDETMPPANK